MHQPELSGIVLCMSCPIECESATLLRFRMRASMTMHEVQCAQVWARASELRRATQVICIVVVVELDKSIGTACIVTDCRLFHVIRCSLVMVGHLRHQCSQQELASAAQHR
jgi:hypothetical protein